MLLFVHLFSEPNGSLTLPEKDPIAILQALQSCHKEGILYSKANSQEVIWKRDHENGFREIQTHTNNRVAYDFSGGRLGDCLLTVLHGLWVSMKTGYPLVYRTFPYSDYFKIHHLPIQDIPRKNKQLKLPDLSYVFPKLNGITYLVRYFPDCKQEFETYPDNYGSYLELDWQDPQFKKEIRSLLDPIDPPKTIQRPKDRISIAVHVRNGGTFDDFEEGRAGYPLKFLPVNLYIEGLKKAVAFYAGKPLFVYVFTDHVNPPSLVEEFRSHFQGQDILFDGGRNHPVDDFFSISQFDCLVRGMSNFSVIAGYYGNPQLTLTPHRSHFGPNKETIIDEWKIYFSF